MLQREDGCSCYPNLCKLCFLLLRFQYGGDQQGACLIGQVVSPIVVNRSGIRVSDDKNDHLFMNAIVGDALTLEQNSPSWCFFAHQPRFVPESVTQIILFAVSSNTF